MSQSAFEALGLDARIVSTLTQNQLTTPTPVQEQTIPLLQRSRPDWLSANRHRQDRCLCCRRCIAWRKPRVKGPWRPRAGADPPPANWRSKVARQKPSQGPATHENRVCGGRRVLPHQNDLLAKPHEILVATPGRLIDHVNARRIDSRAWKCWCWTKPTACWTWVSLTTCWPSPTSCRKNARPRSSPPP